MTRYANLIGYSDVSPYEVTRVVSAKTMVIREMDTERDPTWTPESPLSGFDALASNNLSQRWLITSNPNGYTTRIRLRNDGRWYSKMGRHSLSDEPRRFYDYGF